MLEEPAFAERVLEPEELRLPRCSEREESNKQQRDETARHPCLPDFTCDGRIGCETLLVLIQVKTKFARLGATKIKYGKQRIDARLEQSWTRSFRETALSGPRPFTEVLRARP